METSKSHLILEIARHDLLLNSQATLEVRGRDHLDFHSVSVTAIKKSLEKAYDAGRASLLSPNNAIETVGFWRFLTPRQFEIVKFALDYVVTNITAAGQFASGRPEVGGISEADLKKEIDDLKAALTYFPAS
jgi:hypothetical protein